MRRKPRVLALTGAAWLEEWGGGGGEGWGMCDFTMMDAGPYLLLWQELISCKLLEIPAVSKVLPEENIENIL
jgi:hypothetical protein